MEITVGGYYIHLGVEINEGIGINVLLSGSSRVCSVDTSFIENAIPADERKGVYLYVAEFVEGAVRLYNEAGEHCIVDSASIVMCELVDKLKGKCPGFLYELRDQHDLLCGNTLWQLSDWELVRVLNNSSRLLREIFRLYSLTHVLNKLSAEDCRLLVKQWVDYLYEERYGKLLRGCKCNE